MKTRLPVLLFLSALFFIFCAGDVSAGNPTKDPTYATIHDPYHEVDESQFPTRYTFSNTYVVLYGGYMPYMRMFIPPGTIMMDMMIIEGGGQSAVARHQQIPVGDPGKGSIKTYKLSEMASADCYVKGAPQGYLHIFGDAFEAPYLPTSRAGWLYVKVAGGVPSQPYNTQFNVIVDPHTYNTWWATIVKAGGWDKCVESVTTYVDPMPSTAALSVTPSLRAVSKDAGTTAFSVSNTGTGTMPWAATVTSGADWLNITSGASGTDAGTINCSFTANPGTSARTGTIRVTATGATGSPVDVTVTQAPAEVPPAPVLSVTPLNTGVSQIAGTTKFSVSNTGTGTMQWTAVATSKGNWLSISPTAGSNSGTITCSFNTNANESARTGTIRVTATGGATGSPKDVTVTQAGTVSSALSPVPNTGLTKCYDNTAEMSKCPVPGESFYGQDTNYPEIHRMSYTKLDIEGKELPDDAGTWVMVRDNVTRLIWEAKTKGDGENYDEPHNANNTYTWYDSNPDTNGGNAGTRGDGVKNTEYFLKALNSANYGGYSDWRLPTIKELVYIVDYGNLSNNPWIDILFFPNTVSDLYWTSTTVDNDETNAHVVNFSDGSSHQRAKSEPNHVRAVRGGQPESQVQSAIGSFDAADSGSLDYASTAAGVDMASVIAKNIDQSAGLMWGLPPTSNSIYPWLGALSYCESSSLGGYKDWRLPTIKELQSSADFLTKDNIFYWSSTTNMSATDTAWGVSNGDIVCSVKSQGQRLRLVRGVPFLSVIPASNQVKKEAGTFSFDVSNKGNGKMTWEAAVTSGDEWLSITSGTSVTSPGAITCSVEPNADALARTGTIRVTALDGTISSLGSPVDVTVVQAGTAVLSANPANQNMANGIGTTTFSVSNTGTGKMPWTAAATSGDNWLSITSGATGEDTGTISCSFTANPDASVRKGTISVTADGVTGSPVNVTVTQAGTTVLFVSPTNRNVAKDIGTTAFSVSNAGTGSMPWKAVISEGNWLSITSGAAGTDNGTINCSFTANTAATLRTGKVRITATGATSPVDVTVTQAASSSTQTGCMATIDGKLLQIPFLSYVPTLGTLLSYWADFLYVPTENDVFFKLANFGNLDSSSFKCAASTLSDSKIIHIPDLLLDNKHYWVDMEYFPYTDGNIYFKFTNFEPVK